MMWSAGGRKTLRAQAALKTSRAQGGPPTISTPGATWPLYLSWRVASTSATFHQHLEFASKKPWKKMRKNKMFRLFVIYRFLSKMLFACIELAFP